MVAQKCKKNKKNKKKILAELVCFFECQLTQKLAK